jgi:hypothetical protein
MEKHARAGFAPGEEPGPQIGDDRGNALAAAGATTKARRASNIGILFDDNRLNYETEATLRKLTEMQLGDGRWPWFPGGHGNDYITLYITTGFGRLRHLGADIDVAPAIRALQRLDAWMTEEYERIQKWPSRRIRAQPDDALYLYGRSFFLKDMPIAAQHKTAIEFFLKQARKFWLQTDCRQTQGHLAIALKRFNALQRRPTIPRPGDIMKSIKERSVSNEEMGMFWRDTELELVVVSRADRDAGADDRGLRRSDGRPARRSRIAASGCSSRSRRRIGRPPRPPPTPSMPCCCAARTSCCPATALVQVKLGGINVTPAPLPGRAASPSPQSVSARVEPGTGFYEYRFRARRHQTQAGRDHRQEGGRRRRLGQRELAIPRGHEQGHALRRHAAEAEEDAVHQGQHRQRPGAGAGQGPAGVGDELVVRIELRVDRDMEYVHLKDQRGSGTEPVNVLSRYKYQDGLAYYESTRDTASHFFIDYLPKGTYVFEYSTRVQLRGQYQTGVAQIQCMYAPEFNSHSESLLSPGRNPTRRGW